MKSTNDLRTYKPVALNAPRKAEMALSAVSFLPSCLAQSVDKFSGRIARPSSLVIKVSVPLPESIRNLSAAAGLCYFSSGSAHVFKRSVLQEEPEGGRPEDRGGEAGEAEHEPETAVGRQKGAENTKGGFSLFACL